LIKRGWKLHKAGRENGLSGFNRDWQAQVAIILLFLVMIIPLRQLAGKVEELQRQSREWLTTTNQARLKEELVQFKKELCAEAWVKNFVDTRMQKLDVDNAFTDLEALDIPSLRRQALNKIGADVQVALNEDNRSPQPFFVVVADDSLTNLSYKFSDALRQTSTDDQETAMFLCRFAIMSVMNRVESLDRHRLAAVVSKWGGKVFDSKFLKKNFHSLISSFMGTEPDERKVQSYLSDLYDFNRLFFYSYTVMSSKKFLGVVVVGYLDSAIDGKDILSQALESALGNATRRVGSKTRFSAPNLPGKFVSERLSAGVMNSESLYIGVELINPAFAVYTDSLVVLHLLTGFCMLAGYAALLHSVFFGLVVRLNLRKKLMIILAVALVLPAILVAIIGRGITNDYLSSRVDMAQSYLASSLNELELTYQESESRLTLNHLRFKFQLSELWGDRIGDVPDKAFLIPYLGFYNEQSYFYDRSGASLHLYGTNVGDGAGRFLSNNAVRLLSNLSGLISNATTRRHIENLEFSDAFVAEFSDMAVLQESSAHEAEVISQMETPNALAREIFHLYASSRSRPFRPGIIGLLNVRPDAILQNLISSNPAYPLKFFERHQNEYLIDIGLAMRNNERIRTEFWLDYSQRRQAGIRGLFDNAMELKSAGAALTKDDADSVNAWRYRIDSPIIYAGTATFNNDSLVALYLDVMPFAVLIYSILILLVISEVVAGLFVTPIEAVSQGVKAVAGGEELTLRLQISNNDEFDRMGHSFNAMTEGLLQKRHISRFVSDRLLAQIGQVSLAETAAEEEVTVLASDLRNFTGISEKYSPEMVVAVLNDYFTEMDEAIKAEGGSIDKFIGDAIIAVFYARDGQMSAVSACSAARRMRSRLEEFNRMQQNAGRFAIENGIGIATGSAVSASVGEKSGRREFVVTGEPVERAEELEALSKQGQHSKIIVDAVTRSYVEEIYSMRSLADHERCFEIVDEVQNETD